VAFSRLDRNLLVRVAKHLQVMAGKADALVDQHRGSGSISLAAAAKADADRIHRDLRDVEGLRKRLEGAYPDSMKAPPPPVKVDARLGEE
jgi:hypothetical protein